MSPPLDPGALVGARYRVDRFLGAGGMGAVYAGTDLEAGLPVALKVLTVHHRADLLRRFEREARLLARVRHPNVVAILAFTTLDDGAPCIVMELVEGEGLDTALRREGGLDWPDAVALGIGVLGGLDAIHAQGIVHRDVKPSNVLVAPGDPPLPRLIDLGVARPEREDATRLTRDGALVGTPTYMSPEQVLGQPVDRRSDVYGVGLLLHELLTGGVPFGDASLSGALRRVSAPIPPLAAPRGRPDIPPGLDAAVRATLAPDPAARPASAAALRQRLENLLPPGAAIRGWQPRLDRPSAPAPRRGSTQPTPPTEPCATPVVPAAPPDTLTWTPEPAPGPSEPTVTVAPAPVAATSRYLLVARLPPSRLASPPERAWLAGLAGTDARAFVVGAGLWVALQARGSGLDDADDAAARLAEALKGRYGGAVRLEWTTVDGGFAISAAALVGGRVLPPELVALIERVSTG